MKKRQIGRSGLTVSAIGHVEQEILPTCRGLGIGKNLELVKTVERVAAARGISPAQVAEIDELSEVFRPGAAAGERFPPGYFKTLGA